MDGKKLKRFADELEHELGVFKRRCELHGKNFAATGEVQPWYGELEESLRRARATMTEAMVISFLQQHHGNQVKLKSLVRAQRKSAEKW